MDMTLCVCVYVCVQYTYCNDNEYGCVVSDYDSKFWILDLSKKQCHECRSKYITKTQSCVFVDKRYVVIGGTASGSSTGIIEIWDKITRKSVKQVRAKFNSGVCALVNVGKLLYASSKIGELIVFDTLNDFKSQALNVQLFSNPIINTSENGMCEYYV